MNERNNLVTFMGKPLTLLGAPVTVGQKAPDFALLDGDLTVKTLADFAGKVLIVAAVPSLDTSVCDTETRRFNAEAAALGEKVRILGVSMDLPFAQKRWCAAAGIDRVQTLSDYREASFGLNWGVLIKELRLLARSVFVIGADGVVKYAQIVPEVTQEPDYAAALAAAKALV